MNSDDSFGDWLHQQITETFCLEQEAWAIDRVRRVSDRLQAGLAPSERYIVEIPWIDLFTAFTAPGRYIYFCRLLYERCATDEHVAFVIAHEIAHHELGHLDLFTGWARRAISLPGSTLLASALHALESRLYGPEKECEADRYALDLCRAAGYDGRLCLGVFDALEQYALDMRDLDMVYGLDAEADDELDENAPWTTKAQIWVWQRKRGYLPIQDRRQRLLKHLHTRDLNQI
jgi:predicted Zn-dependent protease